MELQKQKQWLRAALWVLGEIAERTISFANRLSGPVRGSLMARLLIAYGFLSE